VHHHNMLLMCYHTDHYSNLSLPWPSTLTYNLDPQIWHWQYQDTTTTTIVLRPFVRDYPGELVPEETFTHPPSWTSFNLYQLLPVPSTTQHMPIPSQPVLLQYQYYIIYS